MAVPRAWFVEVALECQQSGCARCAELGHCPDLSRHRIDLFQTRFDAYRRIDHPVDDKLGAGKIDFLDRPPQDAADGLFLFEIEAFRGIETSGLFRLRVSEWPEQKTYGEPAVKACSSPILQARIDGG